MLPERGRVPGQIGASGRALSIPDGGSPACEPVAKVPGKEVMAPRWDLTHTSRSERFDSAPGHRAATRPPNENGPELDFDLAAQGLTNRNPQEKPDG